MTRTYENYVDGDWRPAENGDTFEVRNPADTTTLVGRFQASDERDVAAAVDAATATQDEWASTPAPARGKHLKRAGEHLESRREELVETLVREEGKTRSEAAGEVGRAIDIFHYYAEKARDLGGVVKSPSAASKDLYTDREPLGTVALVTPWNYPVAIPAWKLAPALATGNTVVHKPASAAPTVSTILYEALDAAGVPAGVANMVTGSGRAVGTPLIEHDAVDGVSFTGSTSVGTSIAQSATDDMKRVQCEMGGKNPTVIMPSGDLDEAVDIVSVGAFGTTGQSCTACSRAIVHEAVAEEFRDAIVEAAESMTIGPGLDDPDMGPQASRGELDSTLEYIEIAEDEGATLETGGGQPDGPAFEDGYFVEPTVFSGVSTDMRIAQEEVFGPVLAIIEIADFEEAMAVANDVEYGLSASIVTGDLTDAHRFVDEIEAGVVKVNEKTTGVELHAPFGGYKQSSTNTYREQGDAAIDFFTTTKTVYLNY